MDTPRIACRERIVALHLAGRCTKEIVRSLNLSKTGLVDPMTIQGNRQDSRPLEKWTSPKCPHTGADKASETQDQAHPRRSMRKMAREAKVSKKTIRNLVHKDLNFCSYKLQKHHSLSITAKENRRKKAKAILDRVKFHDLPPIIFSDEKIFTVEAAVNK